jgi:hypothetical protein
MVVHKISERYLEFSRNEQIAVILSLLEWEKFYGVLGLIKGSWCNTLVKSFMEKAQGADFRSDSFFEFGHGIYRSCSEGLLLPLSTKHEITIPQ